MVAALFIPRAEAAVSLCCTTKMDQLRIRQMSCRLPLLMLATSTTCIPTNDLRPRRDATSGHARHSRQGSTSLTAVGSIAGIRRADAHSS
ncbi:hypothetical protein OE88DRAFT_1810827 [Heliocybe sulcata]|uniref:Uncharacterized protein n=1 Tax=Heliocybe sulcata TaxID=5364 RepID=A0A5C3MRQ7_9AGAM|nr:hypothetical protein OE88DRAFT_1810827 [Heliocybe sulcata]